MRGTHLFCASGRVWDANGGLAAAVATVVVAPRFADAIYAIGTGSGVFEVVWLVAVSFAGVAAPFAFLS